MPSGHICMPGPCVALLLLMTNHACHKLEWCSWGLTPPHMSKIIQSVLQMGVVLLHSLQTIQSATRRVMQHALQVSPASVVVTHLLCPSDIIPLGKLGTSNVLIVLDFHDSTMDWGSQKFQPSWWHMGCTALLSWASQGWSHKGRVTHNPLNHIYMHVSYDTVDLAIDLEMTPTSAVWLIQTPSLMAWQNPSSQQH